MRLYLYDGGVGDAIALTATVREYHRRRPLDPLYVSTAHRYDEIFRGNPHLVDRPEGGAAVVLQVERHGSVGNIAVSFGLQCGIEVLDHTPELFLTESDRNLAPTVNTTRPIIAVDPWARSETRRWKWERWEEVVNALNRRYVVVGVGRRVPDHLRGSRSLRRLPCSVDFTDQIGIRQTAAFLERADLFLGMDSGGAHLSAAVGCPSVVLYSRSRWYSRAYWNTTPVYAAAHPCEETLCNWRCGNPNGVCLDHIQADRVLEAVEIALGRFPRGSQKAAPCRG